MSAGKELHIGDSMPALELADRFTDGAPRASRRDARAMLRRIGRSRTRLVRIYHGLRVYYFRGNGQGELTLFSTEDAAPTLISIDVLEPVPR